MSALAPTRTHLTVPPAALVAVTAALAVALVLAVVMVLAPWRDTAPSVPAPVGGGDAISACELRPVSAC